MVSNRSRNHDNQHFVKSLYIYKFKFVPRTHVRLDDSVFTLSKLINLFKESSCKFKSKKEQI